MYLIHSFLPGGEPGESCTHNNSVAAFCWPVFDVVDKEKGKKPWLFLSRACRRPPRGCISVLLLMLLLESNLK